MLLQPRATGTAAVAAATVLLAWVAVTSATPDESALSATTVERANSACRETHERLRPYEIGPDLEDQVAGFTRERKRLAVRLVGAGDREADTARLIPLAYRLLANNRFLRRAGKAAESGDVPGAYAELRKWERRLPRERRQATRLKLAECSKLTEPG
jgi:hypothetical protein